MSYILEALAKSQRERELGRVPTPTSDAYTQPPPAARKKAPLFIGLVLAMLAVGGLFYALTAQQVDAPPAAPPAKPTPPAASPAMPNRQQTIDAAPEAAPEPEEIPLRTQPAATETPAVHQPPSQPQPKVTAPQQAEGAADEDDTPPLTPAPVDAGERTDTATHSRPQVSELRRELIELQQQLKQRESQSASSDQRPAAAIEQQNAVADSPPVPSAAASATPPESRPYPAQQLPADVYRRLPPRKLSVLAYSQSPPRRFVVVNSQKLIEGSRSKEGLVVEEIRKDGVVFSFEGHRFFDSP